MLIDCDRCEMRDIACRDCMVTALLGPPGTAGRPAEIGAAEWRALRVLADARMVLPLRMREPMARAS